MNDFNRKLGDPKHPLYSLIKFTLLVGALTFLLYGQASNFDETELRVIGQFVPVLIGGKYLSDKFAERMGKQ
jgi:hypothetical protein